MGEWESLLLVIVAARRLTLARPFKAGNSRRVRLRREATPETRDIFNRRYATGSIYDLIPALKGRAKVSRRSATKSATQFPHYRKVSGKNAIAEVGLPRQLQINQSRTFLTIAGRLPALPPTVWACQRQCYWSEASLRLHAEGQIAPCCSQSRLAALRRVRW
jgi:hypothetical protein